MRNIFLVIKHEIKTMLSKPSFWLITFLLPAAIMAISVGSQILGRSALAEGGDNPLLDALKSGTPAIGYVDEAGLVERIPDQIVMEGLGDSVFYLSPGDLREYPDAASAQAALDAGEIRQYYLVPADFLATGNLLMIDANFSLFSSLNASSGFEYVLTYNLTGDEPLARALSRPTTQLETRRLAPQRTSVDDDSLEAFYIPFGAMFIFFFIITMTGGLMLQSVSKEKENRTVEILLLSLRPRELMLGKVLGLGAIALLQMIIWSAGGLIVLGRGESLAAGLSALPDGFLVWALLYFVLGYLLYAAMLGAIGALAPTAREGSQFTFIVLLPLMIPLWLSNTFIMTPNDTPAVVVSLFPFSAPVAMLTRLAASASVPVWQPITGLILLAITTYLFVLLSARFFRADTLLSFGSLNWRSFLRPFRK